jgi:hypothetical protein
LEAEVEYKRGVRELKEMEEWQRETVIQLNKRMAEKDREREERLEELRERVMMEREE